MPQCAQCGQQLTEEESSSLCDSCRQQPSAVLERRNAASSERPFLITNLLLAVNIGVFVLMVLNRVPLLGPTSDQIVRWGGNFGPLSLGTQPWRLLTNVFVHIGVLHILANMWALFVLGRLAESLYGRGKFLAIYLISGLAGSVASLLSNPMGVSAGASGALFGTAGALIATLYAGKLPLPRHMVRPVLWTLLFWALFDLAYGFWKTGVDNAAHIGGLVAGVVIGYPLGHYLGNAARAQRWRARIFTFAVIALGTFALVVWRLNSFVVQVERARALLNRDQPDQAIVLLQSALQKRPKEAYIHVLMAQALERKKDFSSSEKEYKQAIQLAPNNGAIWRALGTLYKRNQQWEAAASSFTRAATLSKDSGGSWFEAGVAYLQLDRPNDAAGAFKQAVAANPQFGEAWYDLGFSLFSLKQDDDAIAALQQAVRLLPGSPEAHSLLGNALRSAGHEEASDVEFQKAEQLRLQQQRALQEFQRRRQQQPK